MSMLGAGRKETILVYKFTLSLRVQEKKKKNMLF